MNTKCLIIVLALLSGTITNYQEIETTCDCEIAFNDLVQKVEDSYIVLAQMRIDGTANEYDKRIERFQKESPAIEAKNYTKFLQDFLNYFEDGHLFAFEQPIFSDEELASNKMKIKGAKKSVESILSILNYQKDMVEKNGLDGIIGRWTNGQSELVIIKDEGYYRAYIISSKVESLEPGELKAEFKQTENEKIEGTYYYTNYTIAYKVGGLYKQGTLLAISGVSTWAKIEPVTTSNRRELEMVNKEDGKFPTIQKLDDKNTLFSIPSFSSSTRSEFKKLLRENKKLLNNTTNLIFDIRGNGGGSGSIYFDIMKFYAQRPKPSKQGLVLASRYNHSYFEQMASRGMKKLYGSVADRIEDNMGKIVKGPNFAERKFPKPKSKIKNVIMLTDGACMSAAESFILHSKIVSDNKKVFGSPTKGGIDYTSVNVLKIKSGKQNILFGYPTGTWHNEVIPKNGGYNKTGIIPDVHIDKNVEDKVQFIIEYFEK